MERHNSGLIIVERHKIDQIIVKDINHAMSMRKTLSEHLIIL